MRYRFRGKPLGSSEWVYGSLVEGPEGCRISASWEFDEECTMFVPKFFEVDPETVGQWTGLHDRNGKEIYEGDKVKHLGEEMIVVYQPPSFVMKTRANSKTWREFVMIKDNPQFESVIGSIHDIEEAKG